MKRLAGIIKKEILELVRDIQTLLLLIIMPSIFILVMSLSMQALFQSGSNIRIKIPVVDIDKSRESKLFIDNLKKADNISIIESDKNTSVDELSDMITAGRYKFGLVLTKNFSAYVRDVNKQPGSLPMSLYIDPAMQMPVQLGVKNQLMMELSKLKIGSFFDKNAELMSYTGFTREGFIPSVEQTFKTIYVFKNKKESARPSAAQQSVPAWLVFSMYFIVIPIALVFHTEKNNGTLQRLKSINIKSRYLLAGKIVAYYIISLIQTVCMLALGRYIVPLLGGDIIHFGDSYFGLFLIASCTGINAISYGLFMSIISKNINVASGAGVILIVILSAIGGIMVPKFVMPDVMQKLANISPLSWGMEGFLDIMLRNGTVGDIMPKCLLLIGTSCIMLAITGIALKKK